MRPSRGALEIRQCFGMEQRAILIDFQRSVRLQVLERFVLEDEKLHYLIIILYGTTGNDINTVKKQINGRR